LRQGNEALKQGDAEGALSLYQSGIEKSPRSHMLHGNIAQVLLSMGRFQEAVEAADEAIKLCPDWPKPYFRKGSALEAMGDTQGALAAFGTCSVLLDEQVHLNPKL
jgi:tetratricopeptide (TPR) repeat protein